MKRIFVFIMISLALLAGGCGEKTPQKESSVPEIISQQDKLPETSSQSEAEPAPEIPSPPAELTVPGKVTVYTLRPDGKLYDTLEQPADETTTLGNIASMVAQALELEIPVLEMTQQKSMVTVNLAPSFFELNSKAEIDVILNSLATTLYHNHFVDNVHYQVDGKYETGLVDDRFVPVPLKLVEGTPEEFAAIRAQIPYKEKSDGSYENYNPIFYGIAKQDETARQISYLLSMVGLIHQDVASPRELMEKQEEKTREWLVWRTNNVSSFAEYEDYSELALPISASVEDSEITIQEHVEQRAKALFGEDFVLTHGPAGIFKYFKTEGVYTPPHRGGGYNLMPVVLDYQDNGDTITAQVAYIVNSMGGFTFQTAEGWGESEPVPWDWPDGTPAQREQLLDLINNKAPKSEVVVNKAADGSLTFQSYKGLS